MSDLDRFKKLVDDIWEMVFGTPRREEKDIGQYIGLNREKPKRARGKKGKFLADNPMTKEVNEAWVGGKAPKKKKRKK